MPRKKTDKIPEFRSLEEEKAFWNKRFEDGAPVRITSANVIREFYNFELKDLDLDRLYKIAQEQNIDLDQFIRETLNEAIQRYDKSTSVLSGKTDKATKVKDNSQPKKSRKAPAMVAENTIPWSSNRSG